MGTTPPSTSPRHAASLTPNKLIPSPAVRRWLYGVLAAAGAVLTLYGIVTHDQLELWLQLASSVLLVAGPTLAALNTPTR